MHEEREKRLTLPQSIRGSRRGFETRAEQRLPLDQVVCSMIQSLKYVSISLAAETVTALAVMMHLIDDATPAAEK